MVLGLSFIVFCMLTLWVAWKASTNITSLRDYVLSHQRFGQLSLFATIVASFVGGGVVMGTAQKTFQFGIGHGLGLLGFGLQLILTGWWIAPRMGRFRKLISLGDLIARYYGKVPQILTGVFWLSFCVGILAAQMSAMGNLMTNLLGFDRTLCILVSAAVVVIYCYWGGIKAVVSIDHLQFVLLSIALFLVTIVGIYQLGGWQSLVNHVPTTHWSLTSHLTGWELTMIFFSFLLGFRNLRRYSY